MSQVWYLEEGEHSHELYRIGISLDSGVVMTAAVITSLRPLEFTTRKEELVFCIYGLGRCVAIVRKHLVGNLYEFLAECHGQEVQKATPRQQAIILRRNDRTLRCFYLENFNPDMLSEGKAIAA